MHVLILGANSDIGLALAHRFAGAAGTDIYLASRDRDEMEKNEVDLSVRYRVAVKSYYFDATDYGSHAAFYSQLDPKPDVVVLAFGYLGEQAKGQEDFDEAKRILDTNLTGAMSILELVAADFEARKSGTIIVLSSVAGERGRKTNYLYGAAKGGLTTYASGLRNRLFAAGVRVLTVLPGFVRTKMTRGMPLPQALTANPDQAAAEIFRAYRRRDVIYTKKIWRLVMFVIRCIPEWLFKRMNL